MMEDILKTEWENEECYLLGCVFDLLNFGAFLGCWGIESVCLEGTEGSESEIEKIQSRNLKLNKEVERIW